MTEPAGSKASGKGTFAVLGLFGSPDELLRAIGEVKGKSPGKLEAYTPYPIHGIEKALELKRSPLGGMVLVMGILGVIVAIGLQGWTSAVDYPIVTGGKEPFSWQAFVPVLFEVMVLFATFTAGLGMLFLLNRLPFFRHPVLRSRSMASITRDRFALSIEREGRGAPEIDAEAAGAALRAAGAQSVEVVESPESLGPVSSNFIVRSAAGIAIACFVAGLATYWAVKLFPVLPPMAYMQEQPRVDPYSPSDFFADGRSMRYPVPGAVARDHLPYAVKTQDEAADLVNPLSWSRTVLRRGKKVYEIHCSVCHGAIGDGVSTLTEAYGAKPANLVAQTFREYPDGKIYHAIAAGKNSMPSYAADIPEEDRWAVVHYVRVLQRAQNATDTDIEEALEKR